MAEAPPAFNPPRQQSNNKVWLWLLVAVGGLCVLCILGLFFGMRSLMGTSMSYLSCMMNGSITQNALLAYAKDHNGQLPDAETWQDDFRPYYERIYEKTLKETNADEMPSWIQFKIAKPGEVLSCDLGGGTKSGFAYNDAVAGKKLDDIADHTTTMLIWETATPAYNAHGLPESRTGTPPKLFGDKRPWMDFPIEGEPDPFKSENTKMDIKIRPEDGLPPKAEGTSGTGTNTGA